MPVLRDLYPGRKKSTSAYLPAYSLSIAAQPLNCPLLRNNLHNTLLRVTMQVIQNDSRWGDAKVHRKEQLTWIKSVWQN